MSRGRSHSLRFHPHPRPFSLQGEGSESVSPGSYHSLNNGGLSCSLMQGRPFSPLDFLEVCFVCVAAPTTATGSYSVSAARANLYSPQEYARIGPLAEG